MQFSKEDLFCYQSGSDVPLEDRHKILDDIERIMSTNWAFSQRHWSDEDSPFHPEFGIILTVRDGQCLAYNICKRLEINGRAILYHAGSAVHSKCHGMGIYGLMTRKMLEAEHSVSGTKPLYLSWRTRNPLIWIFNASLCSSVIPSPLGSVEASELDKLVRQIATTLYPEDTLETPSMIMPDAYAHLSERDRNYAKADQSIVQWFADALPNPANAFMCLGRLK